MLLDIYHKLYQAPFDGHGDAIYDPGNVHGHAPAGAEIVCPNVFWG